MEIPKDIYFYIIRLMDNVDVTKGIRSLCKMGLLASQDYHTLLLREKVNIHCEQGEWILHKEENVKYGSDYYSHWHPVFGESITFNITQKDLYKSFTKSTYLHKKYKENLHGCRRFMIENKREIK
jgi:hypothetical protein